jgi:hypothetical protein
VSDGDAEGVDVYFVDLARTSTGGGYGILHDDGSVARLGDASV